MHFVLFALGAAILMLLFSGGYVFFVACTRGKDLPWLNEEELKKTSYGPFYDHIYAAHQWLQEHETQQISVTSADGLTLRGIWVPAKDPKGTIILAHGYRSCFLADFGLVLEFYHNYGLNLLLPYQRAHGNSDGKFITFGAKECKDMLAWIEYHNQRVGTQPLVLSGLSMGASTVLYLADENLPKNVKGIIADCGFTSAKDILAHVYKKVTHLPAVPTLYATDLFARVFAGFSIGEKDTRKTLSVNRLPVLLVHGTADDFVPCEMTRQGYEACTGPKQLFLVDGATHGVSFIQQPEAYKQLVTQFLDNYLV